LATVAASWDTSRYVTLFVSEATEHLDALSKDVVRLEKEPSADAIDSAFRHAHSVKGMTASMGLEATMALAHRLEDLLDAVRVAPLRFDKALADLVLQAVDALQAHVKAISAAQPVPVVTTLVDALHEALRQFAPAPPPDAAPAPTGAPTSSQPAATTPQAAPSDSSLPPRFSLALRVSTASNQPGVRGFLAYKRLSTLGNVFALTPSLEDIKAGRLQRGLILLELETEQPREAVKKTLATVADVELESIEVVAHASPTQPAVEKHGELEPRPVGQEPARTVRVRTELMDEFLDAAGELLLATARVREVGKGLPEVLRPPLDEAIDRLHGLVRSLHGKVMTARMTPLDIITNRLPRAARDIARRRGRDIELVITGADTELDRAIVDELNDPVLHLLRNAIDHGVEPPEERRMRGKPARATVQVNVRRERDRVVLEVRDDGRGMDVERLKASALERGLITADSARLLSERDALALCCLPGVSTAATVTDISGRGVGMDAVKRAVESVGGVLDIESTKGVGTTFRLALPLTVAMVNLLLVGVGDDVYGLPITKVLGVVETRHDTLASSQNVPVLHFGQHVVPVRELAALLEVPGLLERPDVPPFVVVEGDDGRVALRVDRLLGQEEVVLKALSRPLDLLPGLAGVTILGNGRPVFILDVARLERRPGAEA
jgi:two-component system chemotaxis sensor kinase CheA